MKRWVLLALALTLAACNSSGRINYADYGRYSASTALTAAPNGKMALAVYGSPVAGDRAALAKTIAAGLNGTHVDYRTKFVPTETPDLTGYRTVVVFGPVKPEDVCRVSDSEGMAKSAPALVTAGFCLGGEPLSYTAGSLAAIETVDDPALVSYMRHVGYALFPDENPNYESRSRKPFSW